MTAFALVGSTGEAFKDGIGVYGLMASWSGIIHSACFFLVGVRLWQFGKRFGFTTQIQYFRDRFESPTLGLAKSARTFRPTVILHPLFIMIVWVPCVLLGVWAAAAVVGGQPVIPPELKNPNAVLGIMVAKLANPYLTGLLTVGILAAIMSSLDSQFLCIGSMFTHDIVLHHFGEDRFSDKQRILMGRLFVLGIVLTAYLLSLAEPRSVFVLGVWCFSGFASLFPLVLASLYWKRVTRAGAIASVVVAAIVWLVLFYKSDWGANRTYLFLDMMPVATIFAAATVALVVVSLVTKPPSQAVLDRYFSNG